MLSIRGDPTRITITLCFDYTSQTILPPLLCNSFIQKSQSLYIHVTAYDVLEQVYGSIKVGKIDNIKKKHYSSTTCTSGLVQAIQYRHIVYIIQGKGRSLCPTTDI